MKPIQPPRRAQEIQLYQPSAQMQEVELVPAPQHAQGLQIVLSSVLSPKYAQGKQSVVHTQEDHQHAEGLQLVLSPKYAQERVHFHESLAHMQEVQLNSSHQHAEGLQLVLSPKHAHERVHFQESSAHTEEVQLISTFQDAQGLKLVLSPRHAKEKPLFQSSAHMQEVQLISSGQHSQGLQLVLSPRHLQEKQPFHSSVCMQDVQLIPSPEHAQGLELVQSPRHGQEKQVFHSSAYMQLIPSPQHAQGLQLVQSPRYGQEKQLFQPSEHMQEIEFIPSPQLHGQVTREEMHFVDSPTHMQENLLVQATVEVQETQPLHAQAANVKEITEYLISHELWLVPDSVLYEEPTAETQSDLETYLEEINDAREGEEENHEINTSNVEDCVEAKVRKRGGRRHKGHFMKRPMGLSEVIEELQNIDLRENALRCLSGHLVERREQDPDFYRQAGFYIFHSCSTLVILIQEILCVYEKIYADDLNIRRSKRMANVLCLLQCVASNDETRVHFVRAQIPNYLIPFILSENTEEVYENLRALSLSVISILCQSLQKEVILWAVQNDIIEVCFHALDVGSELSKVLAMTVLDSILRVDEGLAAICEPSCNLLPRFIKLCEDLVSVLAYIRGFSPRLLFLVVRSFILLCQNQRALELLEAQLPTQLQDTTFRDVKMEYPLFAYLRHLLLLCTGKASDYLPSADCSPTTPSSLTSVSKNPEDRNSMFSSESKKESVIVYLSAILPVNLNKQDWFCSPMLKLQT